MQGFVAEYMFAKGPPVMMAPTVFRQQFIVVASLLALVAIGVALGFATRNNVRTARLDEAGATVLSASALGHRAFARYLANLGFQHDVVNGDGRLAAGDHGVVVIAEPVSDRAAIERVRSIARSGKTLLVLPKYVGEPDPDRPGWVKTAELLPPGVPARVLSALDKEAAIVRTNEAGMPHRGRFEIAVTTSEPQLIKSNKIKPLLATKHGILIGELQTAAGRVVIVSDPEIISNRGLARGDNAKLALAVVDYIAGPGGRVVFDESVHGRVKPLRHPLAALFSFPLVLVVVQAVVAVVLLLWASAQRLGRPLPPARTLAIGRETLLVASARLLAQPAFAAMLLARYQEAMVRDVSAGLNASMRLYGQALLDWLAVVGSARGVTMPTLTDAGQHRKDSGTAVRHAQAIFHWKREMLNERRGHQGRHRRDPG